MQFTTWILSVRNFSKNMQTILNLRIIMILVTNMFICGFIVNFEYAKAFDENMRIVYLTRFGSEPTEYSRKAKNGTEILPNDKIKCISWEKDIYEWLTVFPPKPDFLRFLLHCRPHRG